MDFCNSTGQGLGLIRNEVEPLLQGPIDSIMDAVEKNTCPLAKLSHLKEEIGGRQLCKVSYFGGSGSANKNKSNKALSISLQTESCRYLETLQISSEDYFCSSQL